MSFHSLPRKGKRAEAAPTFGRGRGPSFLFTIIALVGGFHALLMLGLEVNRLVSTERAVARLERDITALQEESEALGAVIRHKNDASYREQLARQQGFIYPDELRVVTRAPPSEATSTEP